MVVDEKRKLLFSEESRLAYVHAVLPVQELHQRPITVPHLHRASVLEEWCDSAGRSLTVRS